MKKLIVLAILGMFLFSLVSADSISDSGRVKTTLTTTNNNLFDNLIKFIKELFVITGVDSSYEEGEIISITSAFDVDYCANTIVKISLMKGTFTLESANINVGAITQQTITANHQIDSSGLSPGTYAIKDFWTCGGFPITSSFGTPNPTQKQFEIVEQQSTCTENWICGNWGACPSGVQYRTCTDNNNCGTTFDEPDSSQSCTADCTPNCDGKVCGSDGCGGSCGTCSGTCSSGQCSIAGTGTLDAVIYDIQFGPTRTGLENPFTGGIIPGDTVNPGEHLFVQFKVKNNGDTQDYLLEAGIIPKDTAEAWGFSIFDWFTQDNTECCPGQPNIFAKTTELKNGEIDEFFIKIPKSPYSGIEDLCYDNNYWSGEGEYVLYITMKTGCYPEGEEVTHETRIINVGTGNGEISQRIAYNESKLIDLTSSQLKLALCQAPSECPTGASCNRLTNLVEDDKIDDVQNEFLHSAFCIETSVWDRFFGEQEVQKSCGLTGIFMPKSDQIENFNSFFGICSYEDENPLDNIFGWAAFYDLDNDGDKDGTDGMIIAIILFVLLMMFSKMMVFGGFEYEE